MIDAGVNVGLPYNGAAPDLGAYEYVAPPTVPPSITTQPTNQTVTLGQNTMFAVVASGTEPLRYQWYFNTNTPLANATNATLTLNSVQTNDAGGYSVIVTNSAGSTTSVVATLTVRVPPSITTQPQSLVVTQGQNAAFTVVASGTAPLSYQWYFNTNAPLANATNATLTLNNVHTNDADGYSVIVTNSAGSATGAVAFLTVAVPPEPPVGPFKIISIQPLSTHNVRIT